MSNIDQMNLGPRWYVAHTYTGYEDKVKASIEKIVENRGLGHLIYEVQVPAIIEPKLDDEGNPVFDAKTGEQKFTRIKLMPSYVLVKMTMTDESWHVVRNITGVTGFVGPGSEPTPLTDEEVAQLQVEKVETKVEFKLGDRVEIVSGSFEGFSGVIQEIREEKKTVVILANMGKRDMSIEIDFKDVKISE